MKKTITLLCILSLCGCVSGYSQFYTQVPGATPEVIQESRANPPPQTPLVNHSPTVPESDIYLREGYIPIGYSFFNSGRAEPEKNAILQGQKVKADLVVIVNPSFTGSVTSQVPITTPTTQTSNTTGTATIVGAGSPVTVYGNSSTTTYGSKTNYIPVTVNRYDYGAVYFIKRKFSLGVNWRDLTNEERSTLQSNSGLYVTAVVNNTPAFRNDILVGDVILQIDDEKVYGQEIASSILGNKLGQEIELTIYRNGEIIQKRLILGE